MGLWQSGLICTRLLICDDVGSIPTRPTKFSSHDKGYFVYLAHLVERKTGNFDVIGSIPI